MALRPSSTEQGLNQMREGASKTPYKGDEFKEGLSAQSFLTLNCTAFQPLVGHAMEDHARATGHQGSYRFPDSYMAWEVQIYFYQTCLLMRAP